MNNEEIITEVYEMVKTLTAEETNTQKLILERLETLAEMRVQWHEWTKDDLIDKSKRCPYGCNVLSEVEHRHAYMSINSDRMRAREIGKCSHGYTIIDRDVEYIRADVACGEDLLCYYDSNDTCVYHREQRIKDPEGEFDEDDLSEEDADYEDEDEP